MARAPISSQAGLAALIMVPNNLLNRKETTMIETPSADETPSAPVEPDHYLHAARLKLTEALDNHREYRNELIEERDRLRDEFSKAELAVEQAQREVRAMEDALNAIPKSIKE